MRTRRFRLHWSSLVIALLVAAGCARLGVWQLARAAEKTALFATIEARAKAPPVTLASLLDKADPAHYRVRLHGHFDNAHNLLLDNRIVDGVAGYYLVTPFQSDDGHWLLVDRGWLPRGDNRAVLPQIAPIDGDVEVIGRSYVYSARTLTLAEDDLSQAHWPLRVQKIEMQAIGQLLGVELAPFEIRVTPGATLEAGPQLQRPWQDPTASIMGPDRHRAYAVQWFALAVMALLVFVAASFRKSETAD